MRRLGLIVIACAALGGCGKPAGQNSTADQLSNAADQSDPAAAAVLDNAAAQARANGDADGNSSGGMAQDALENAGQAQVNSGADAGGNTQ